MNHVRASSCPIPKLHLSLSSRLRSFSSTKYQPDGEYRSLIAGRQAELGLVFPPHVVVAKIGSHRLELALLKRVQLGRPQMGSDYPFGSVCTFLATIEIAIALHKLNASPRRLPKARLILGIGSCCHQLMITQIDSLSLNALADTGKKNA